MNSGQTVYIFLDEGGNFDFSPTGTKFFTLTSVTMQRPFAAASPLIELRHELIESGIDMQEFHAAEDKQQTRNKVFEVIGHHLDTFRIDSVIVRKCMTIPSWRSEAKFYAEMLGYLLRYVINREMTNGVNHVIVITDEMPVKKKKKAMEKAVKITLTQKLPKTVEYNILHHDSASHTMIQLADYINWAIFRKWNGCDVRHYDLIKSAIKSEFDIFKNGTKEWY